MPNVTCPCIPETRSNSRRIRDFASAAAIAPPGFSPMSRSPPSRRLRSTWLLLFVLACALLGRPLHEAWHLAQPIGAPAGVLAMSPGAALAVQAAGDEDRHDGRDDGGDEDIDERSASKDGMKADGCAWCLFHAQAAAPGGTPQALLAHAEASPPPAALPCGWVRSRDWTVAKPRGPPAA